jgi:hypothetical protein
MGAVDGRINVLGAVDVVGGSMQLATSTVESSPYVL